MITKFKMLAAAGLVAAVLGSSGAQAADAKQIADAFVAALTASGELQATYDSATASGDDVTITNLKITGKNGNDTMTLPSLVISGAAPRDKGGFTAAHLAFDNGAMKSDTANFTWKTASVDDGIVPSPDEIKAKAKLRPFSKLDITGINVTDTDMAAPVDVGEFALKLDTADDGTPRDFTLNVANIALPGALFGDNPQTKSVLDALGYSNFVINLNAEGGYDAPTDALTLRNFTIDTADVGKLAIAGKFGGVSLSKLASDKASEVGTTGKLEGLSIRFDNSGIVERALDMQAKMMGAKREDVVAQMSAAIPFMLSAIGNQPFQDKIAAAAAAFLKDPKSITVAAKPAAPVAFTEILSTVGQSPQTLPDLLAVDITANQ